MRSKVLVVLLVLSVLGAGLFGQSKAKWDAAKKQFAIEPGASIVLGLDVDPLGAALVEVLNKLHPEAKGMVQFTHFAGAGGADQVTQLQGDAPDVVMVIDGEVARNYQSFLNFDPILQNLGANVSQEPFYSSTNPDIKKGLVKYIPAAYDGMAFAWNKTMMDKLGLSTKIDSLNLPNDYNTFEELFALAQKWQGTRPTYNDKQVNIVFPMSLDEVWSAYSSLTTAGWEIFKEGDPTKPGFEKPEFAKGLAFIKAAGDAMISVEASGGKTPGSAMTWRWDDALNLQTAPFLLVGTWMDIKGAETKGGFDLQFAPMPTWKGLRPTSFVKTKGYIINGFTKYPSAASELLRVLYTKEGMQAMIENSSYIPALKTKASITPDYSKDQNKAQMSAAFASNYPEPSATLPANKAKKGMDAYYNIGMNLLYRAVWDGEEPQQAQAEAVKLSADWLAANNK